ncbi:unnamed protein product, partial [marine sediment metagenome]
WNFLFAFSQPAAIPAGAHLTIYQVRGGPMTIPLAEAA